MPNKIKPKRSYTANSVPLTSDLDTHELAINWVDGKAFTKNAAGNIVSVTLGGGGGSTEDAVLRALFVPAAPTSVTATAGNAQATVSWTAPTGVIAQAPITDYVVQFSTNSGSSWTTFSDGTSTATSATVTGLTNGTAVQFRVAAVNALGTGSYSTALSAVTPGVPSDPLFSSVSLLLPMNGDGAAFIDASANTKTVTASGNATQSATQSKFGGKSLYLDGSGDYLTIPGSADFGFGTGNFTVEYWWYPTRNSGDEVLLDFRTGNAPMPLLIGKSSAGAVRCYDGGSVRTGGTMNLNEWNHVAWSRSGSTNSIYLNGTRVIDFTNAFDADSSRGLTIGANVSVGFENAQGYVDDIRITKGSDRGYTGATITVPTAAFLAPISAPTSLTATGGNAQVSLAWTAPAYNGGSAITDYSVQYSSNSGSTWTTFSRTASTTASQVVTGLTNGTAYVFRVAGINANGTGTYTAQSSSVTPSAESLTVSPSSGTSDSGVAYSWSGSGTAASPLQTSDAAAPNGIGWGFGYGANTYRVWQFTCGVSGTLTVEFGGRENDGAEIPIMVRYVRNGTLSTTFVGSQTFFGTYGARRTLTVSAGDVIKLSSTTGNSSSTTGDWTDYPSYSTGKFRLWIS